MAQGNRGGAHGGTISNAHRRLLARYPLQKAFYDRLAPAGTLLARVDQATPWCCPRTWHKRIGEAAACRWGRPGSTLLEYRLGDQS
jgi:hypothetical protein